MREDKDRKQEYVCAFLYTLVKDFCSEKGAGKAQTMVAWETFECRSSILPSAMDYLHHATALPGSETSMEKGAFAPNRKYFERKVNQVRTLTLGLVLANSLAFSTTCG